MKSVCMIGSGYVGLVTGACFAELGHHVICVDMDAKKVESLRKGKVPIYEPGLDKLISKNVKKKRLSFTTDTRLAVQKSDVIFIAVHTPPLPDGSADLSFVEACTREVARYANRYKLLVEKSTVPVQTGERIKRTLSTLKGASALVEVASNPEFLKEGSALDDFMHPDRIVIGVESSRAEKILRDLYKKIKSPMVVTDIKSAELIKHASNSFLSMKISYINSLAQICEKVGADVVRVAEGMGLDTRIGRSFLNAGIGYGGSCFPKDVSAFIKIAEKINFDFKLLKATEEINSQQRLAIVRKAEDILWTLKNKTVAVLGLAFKPNTDDIRNAPATDIIVDLLSKGAHVVAHDPVAMEKMKVIFPQIKYSDNAYACVEKADVALIVTEWDEYKKVDVKRLRARMKNPIIIDGRNIFNPADMKKWGFNYTSIGRTGKTTNQTADLTSSKAQEEMCVF